MSNNKFKILTIEDEANIRSYIETILSANDYRVLSAGSCTQGLVMFFSHVPDLVILDLGLPDADGLSFIKEVRATTPTPIIVLSARIQETDKVAALDLGANDYVTKPFGTEELLARVRAALRSRGLGFLNDSVPGFKYSFNGLEIDYTRRAVCADGQEIPLTQTEYNIVALLSQSPGRVLTYAAIIRTVWGSADPGSVKKLQVNMANIRRKLGVKPGDCRFIVNELGVGYRMQDEIR